MTQYFTAPDQYISFKKVYQTSEKSTKMTYLTFRRQTKMATVTLGQLRSQVKSTLPIKLGTNQSLYVLKADLKQMQETMAQSEQAEQAEQYEQYEQYQQRIQILQSQNKNLAGLFSISTQIRTIL